MSISGRSVFQIHDELRFGIACGVRCCQAPLELVLTADGFLERLAAQIVINALTEGYATLRMGLRSVPSVLFQGFVGIGRGQASCFAFQCVSKMDSVQNVG